MMKRIIYDYDNAHIIGKARSSFSILKLIIAIVVVVLIIAIVYVVFFRKGHSKYESKEYFIVISDEFPSLEAAELEAKQISTRGGAGYINSDKTYEVAVSVYLRGEDAAKVAVRYGYIVKSTGKYKVNTAADKTVAVLNLFETIIERIYDISVSLDKEELSLPAAVYALESLGDIIEDAESDIGIQTDKDKLTREIATMFDELKSVSKTFGSVTDGSKLKYCLCEVTYIYINHLKAIS